MRSGLACCLLCAVAQAQPTPPVVVVGSGPAALAFRGADGALLGANGGRAFADFKPPVEPGQGGLARAVPMPTSDVGGLWQVRYADGSVVNAAQCSCSVTRGSDGRSLQLSWRGVDLDVVVKITAGTGYSELVGTVAPRAKTVLSFVLPGRLRVDPDQLQSLVVPVNGNNGVGLELLAPWFRQQDAARATAWQRGPGEPQACALLYGAAPEMRPVDDPPAALSVTPAGRELFGAGLSERLERARESVFRPQPAAQSGEVLIASAAGPFLCGVPRGMGVAWRFSGRIGEAVAPLAREAVVALAKRWPARNKIGLVALRGGPHDGGFSTVAVDEWRTTLRRVAGREVVDLTSPPALDAALASPDFAAVLNPYGEALPLAEGQTLGAVVQRIRDFVSSGGHWIEVAGFPFHYALRPARWLAYNVRYPAAFADFLGLRLDGATMALYRVQPRTWEPWAGATSPAAIFVPGELRCGGDAQGAWLEHAFATYVPAGQSWTAPPVRLAVGGTTEDQVRDYARLNGITRKLADKLSPELLAKLKQSVLVYYGGNAAEKLAHLDRLPKPSLIHFADYLRGGFDKQYPDHLPPHPNFGSADDLRRFFARAHELGHLVSPYTNPTWWCFGPKGPTYEREGDAPLLRGLDGKLSYERYNQNEGYTVTHWHPAVRAANALTVRQFTRDYPVDILFQDQCGARGWQYDANPASPTPYAYTEGLLSMVDEDARSVPLATESGWDRVVNGEVMLCGLSWDLTPHRPARSVETRFPDGSWRIYPLAQQIAHDKCILLYHDLGQFVTNPETMTWALALGFAMSTRIGAPALESEAARGWLEWADRVQKSVCARYLGEPLTAFAHQPGHSVQAAYGALELTANLGEQPLGRLAPHGFAVTAPGLRAGHVRDDDGTLTSFVSEGQAAPWQVWVYAQSRAKVALHLPAKRSGAYRVTFAGGELSAETTRDDRLRVTLPAAPGEAATNPPADLAAKAPVDWPARPALAVVDLGADAHLAWTKAGPELWGARLLKSPLVTQHQLPLQRLSGPDEVVKALDAGPRAVLAIVNPYGEVFPCGAGLTGAGMLAKIRDYVRAGGIWVETGGYSFHRAWKPGRLTESLGPSGLGRLGLPVGDGEVEAPPEPLTITPAGHAWLGAELARRLADTPQVVNRGLPRGGADPGHVALAAGGNSDWLGGYRLGGWGWLWRVGGFYPTPDETIAAVEAVLRHVATRPPLAAAPEGPRRLWQLEVAPQG